MYRARATVDLNAIRANVRRVIASLTPGTRYLAVVKADAYGHGVVPVAHAVLQAGACGLAVTTTEEALELRDGGLNAPILILGPVLDDQVDEAVKAKAEFCVWAPNFVDSVARAAERAGVQVGLHLKVDTGMHRVGVPPRAIADMIDAIGSHRSVRLSAFMTHFATADSDPEFMLSQLNVFNKCVSRPVEKLPGVYLHAANSAAALREPRTHFGLVRCGVAAYGMSPFQRDPTLDGLQPALSLSSYVAALTDVAAGEGVSYGLSWRARRSTRVAVVPIGYGDGFFRSLSNRGDVLIAGKRYPRVGTICMDQFLVDVGRESDVKFGDRVVLMGQDGDERITAEELARHLGTINYEITCSLTARIQRSYVGDPSAD